MTPKSGLKIISLCIVHSLVSAQGSINVRSIKKTDYENPTRSLLLVQDALSHLNAEHAYGISCSKFTLEIDSQNNLIQVDVVESPSAISPSATYSVYNRPSRQVGHLGYFNLATAADGNVVSLTVNQDSGEVHGVVKRFEDEEWIRVGNDDEVTTVDSSERLLHWENTENSFVGLKKLQGSEADRELQVFHSNYLYQVDLHLDIDYEFVARNGGTLGHVFGYINSLFVAANVLFEKEIMTHLNVASIRQTDIYDKVDFTDDALNKMKKENGGGQWIDQHLDLHYALLGRKLQGGLGKRAGIAFVENSLCDSSRGFGLVSGVEGEFNHLDQRFGTDLTRLVYALAHNFGSGPFGGDLDTLLYSIGGYWPGVGLITDVNSWIDSPYSTQRKNPRHVSYNMFRSVNEQTSDCVEVPIISRIEGSSSVPNVSSKSIEIGMIPLEPNHRESIIISPTVTPTYFPSYIPTFLPTYLPTNAPTSRSTENPAASKSSKKVKESKEGKKDDGAKSKSSKITAVRTVSTNKSPTPISISLSPKTGKTNDRSKANKGSKTGKNSLRPTTKTTPMPTRKPSKRTRKPTPKPSEQPTSKAPTETPPPSATIPTTTTIKIPAELRANMSCDGLKNNITAAANVFEITITETVKFNLASSQTLLDASVSNICNTSVSSNNFQRLLQTTGTETVSFVLQVKQNCTDCATALFNEVSGNFTKAVNEGNFTRTLNTVATEQNVTQLSNVNVTSSVFGNYTNVTEPSSLSPTQTPSRRPTVTPTNRPVAPGEPTRNPTTATPSTSSPSKGPTLSPTNKPVAPGEPTRNPTTASPTTMSPSKSPTLSPTNKPVAPGEPTRNPTTASPTTLSPSKSPTLSPTNKPVAPGEPTRNPITASPTTLSPSKSPTQSPTNKPIAPGEPTRNPTTASPTTLSPSRSPTITPTNKPVSPGEPTRNPITASPTTLSPSKLPTQSPSNKPVEPGEPTRNPTTASPTTLLPSKSPTQKPTT